MLNTAKVSELLSYGPVYIIDPVTSNRNSLATQLKTLEKSVKIVNFNTINECTESFRVLNNVSDVHCIFLGMEEGPQKCARFISDARKANNQLYILATASTIGVADLHALISSGVSQVLIRPFNVQTLGERIVLAEEFQKQLLKEAAFIPALNQFSNQVEQVTAGVYVVRLSGWITEHVALPVIKPESFNSKLFIDFESLNGMNSIGIRKWLFWIKDLEKSGFSSFEYENLKPRVLAHVNSVAGFVPANGKINSFYLIYDSETSDLERDIKFKRDHDFDAESMILPEVVEVTIDGKQVPLTIDPFYKNQLGFYKGKINTSGRLRNKAT